MLSQAVRNTNITLSLTAADREPHQEPRNDEPTYSRESAIESLAQLVNDLGSVSATLKKINRTLGGTENTEVFFMLQNFDKLLNVVKKLVSACE